MRIDSPPRILTAELEPAERLIWWGRSRPYPALLDAGVALITLVVPPVVLALLGWMLLGRADRADLIDGIGRIFDAGPTAGSDTLLLLLALTVALFLLRLLASLFGVFLRLLSALSRSLTSLYAVTDRRILIVEGRAVTMLRHIPALRVERGLLGTNIIFGRENRRTGFFAIAESERVEALLRRFLDRRPWDAGAR